MKHGCEVTVAASSAAAARLVVAGARTALSPQAIAAASECIITMLPEPADVEAVVTRPDGIAAGIRRDAVYIDMSTIDPGTTRRVDAVVAERGAHMVDCPVGKTADHAVKGTLTLMAGGPEDVHNKCGFRFGAGLAAQHVREVEPVHARIGFQTAEAQQRGADAPGGEQCVELAPATGHALRPADDERNPDGLVPHAALVGGGVRAVLTAPVLVLLSSHDATHETPLDSLLVAVPAFVLLIAVSGLGHLLFWTLRSGSGRVHA